MSGKRAFLELLKQEGVSMLFGNPGTTELPLMDALAAEHELRYNLVLQEAAAMAMADGYAQASGGLTVVNLHVAPGLGNAMGMLYDAQKSSAPILVTAGQHDQSFNATEPIYGPICRRLPARWSNGQANCVGSRICRGSFIARPKPPWHHRPARSSCRSQLTFSTPKARLTSSRRRASLPACAEMLLPSPRQR